LKQGSTKYSQLNRILYTVIVLLTVIIPVSFCTEFINKFDLVKASVFYFTGGIFFILVSIYFIREFNIGSYENQSWSVDLLDFPVLIFLISVAVSSLLSSNQYISYVGTYERQNGLLLYLYLIILYFLINPFFSDKNRIRSILLVMETTALIVSLNLITGYFGYNLFNLTPENSIRTYTIIGHPIFSAGLITLIFPASLLNVSRKKNKILRITYPLVMLFAVISSMTRTAYVALSAETIIVTILLPLVYRLQGTKLSKYYFVWVTAFVFIVIGLATTFYMNPESSIVQRVISITTLEGQPRWYLWRDSIKMFGDYIFMGTGPGLFSRGFENYASYQLKLAEIKGVFDHAHNNFINTFCTIGIFGGAAYIGILLLTIFKSGKAIFKKESESSEKLFYLFVLCTFTGYFIYGLADFDDISIMLYIFILLSVFKSYTSGIEEPVHKFKNMKVLKNTGIVFFVTLIAFSANSMLSAVNKVSAEYYFSQAVKNYDRGDINEFTYYSRKAITMQPEQSDYRYKFANNMLEYISNAEGISVKAKEEWLKIAREEIINAQKNYPYRLSCLSVLSLIELELGNEKESERIKYEMYKTDTCRFVYRINLATYYLNHNRDSEAIKEINVVLNYDIKNTDALSAKAFYLRKEMKYKETAIVCREILSINPDNRFAKSMTAWLKENDK